MNEQVILPAPIHKIHSGSKRHMIILSKDDYQQEASQKTMGGIIKALGLNMDTDVEVVTVEKTTPVNLGESMNQFKNILVFGVNPKTIGLQMDAKVYKIYTFENFKMVIAHPLSYIANDLKIKQGFWKILQTMYGLV
jgi:hypothetical protein